MAPPFRTWLRSVATLALLAPTACASPPGGGTASRSPAPPDPAVTGPAAAPTEDRRTLLDVAVRADGTGEPVRHVLECFDGAPGPASTHPDPATACADVAELGGEFFTAERAPDLACTQQYGGPATAHVAGTVDGQAVDTEFSRTDGCEISRWDAAQGLLGPGGTEEEPVDLRPG